MREDIDFFPLQVEYRERHYAGGKILGGFFKREARPSEREIFTSRLTDRPIRPLFPNTFKCETQVMITAMSSDGQNMSDVLAGVGASAALMISDIPWNGPIATVRVGRVDGDFVVNPTKDQMEESDMEIVVSGNEQTIVMVEGEAELISEKEFLDAMKFAHGPIKEMIALQKKLAKELKINKRAVPEENENDELKNQVLDLVSSKIDEAIKVVDKTDRGEAISNFQLFC
jgi:polyribonucleotide nucleotidyltransferase